MPFCAQCGTEAAGKYCPSCGAPQGASPAAAPLEENVAAALCYLLWALTGILFLVLEPYNRNRTVRFHAFQSIFTFVALFGCFAVLTILSYMPFVGLLFSMLTVLYPLFGFGLWATLICQAYRGQRWVLPVIGPLAEKQA